MLADKQNKKKRVYLAGRWSEYGDNWKEEFKKMDGLDFYDPEIDSDQTSPDTFFPDDINNVKDSDILVANPGPIPAEATWIEVGYFYALNIKKPGDFCDKIIIIWGKDREPRWSIDFVKKVGLIVESVEEAREKLKTLL